VWGDLGTAWTNVFKGGTATDAKTAFRTAAKNIKAKIG
jgi:hypothetical protein